MDAVVDAVFAGHQAAFLFGGLVCFLIAFISIGDFMWVRISRTRVKGHIKAVHVEGSSLAARREPEKAEKENPPGQPHYNGEIYYSIFQYQLPNGEVIEAYSDTGSSGLASKIPGTPVKLLVKKDDPQEVRRPGFLGLIFGLVFGGMGSLFSYIAIIERPLSLSTIIFLLAILGIIALKIRKAIKPREEQETKEEFAKRRQEERIQKRKEKGRTLTEQEFRDRLRVRDRQSKTGSLIMMIISTGIIAVGYYELDNLPPMPLMIGGGFTLLWAIKSFITTSRRLQRF